MSTVNHTERAPARGRHVLDGTQPKRVFSCARGPWRRAVRERCRIRYSTGPPLMAILETELGGESSLSRTLLAGVAQSVEQREFCCEVSRRLSSLAREVAGSSPAPCFAADDAWRRVGVGSQHLWRQPPNVVGSQRGKTEPGVWLTGRRLYEPSPRVATKAANLSISKCLPVVKDAVSPRPRGLLFHGVSDEL